MGEWTGMKRLVTTGVLVLGLTAAAFAQAAAPTVNVRGIVSSLDGNVLTVAAPIGTATTKITLAPNFTVQYIVKASLTKVAPGSFVGATAVPQVDGSLRALEIHIFPPGVTPGAGSRP